MANYYVDKTHAARSDSTSKASNSESLPWTTIRRGVAGHATSTDSSQAITAGDTLFVKGNGQTYTELSIGGGSFTVPALRPTNTGTSGNPIRIRPFPGHAVTLKCNDPYPVIGTSGGKNYIIWEGFTVRKDMTGSDGRTYGAALTNTTGSEIGYCTIINDNTVYPTIQSSLAIGLICNVAQSCHVHHCDISGFKISPGVPSTANQVAIQVYSDITETTATGDCIFEDNYLHGNFCGANDKDSSQGNIWRRNFINGNSVGWVGNNQGQLATFYIYDNVIDEDINFLILGDGTEFHDNLIRTDVIRTTSSGATVANRLVNHKFWNNVIQHATPMAWRQGWAHTGNEFDYFDYDIYTGTPSYQFASTILNITQMRDLGYETNAQTGITFSNIYDSAWNLKSPYTTAGRGGVGTDGLGNPIRDTVGPVNSSGQSIVASILNTSRYGAAAYAGSPTTNNPPTAVLVITNISSLTVDTDNTASVDTDGTIASRSTNWGDGTANSTTSAPSHTYASPGTYNITLTVTDDGGETDQDAEQVTVGNPAYVQLGAKRVFSGRRLFLAGK